ncbi:MAG: GNAT family N-acetyltransferase [Clostridium sp.]|uniref:GNAT family N-acetyltransferase n=1 Tax=Clostridium sp. TaxID=1506 RepID=UPI003071AF79
MNIEFKSCGINDIIKLRDSYVKTLSSPFDSYLDDHIISSEFYSVSRDKVGIGIGYFAIFEGKLLTQFYIESKYLRHAQNIFKTIVKSFKEIDSAYVCTADELFLSCVCDIENKNISNQAYFFQDNKECEDEVSFYEGGSLRLAKLQDVNIIKELSLDFFEDVDSQIKDGELYVFEKDDNGEVLGFGITEKGQILKGYTSIGMFTTEGYRQKGIGKTIITKLKQLCYENGEIPICGCWYYNTNSKLTLESCGFISKTRLLKVEIIRN